MNLELYWLVLCFHLTQDRIIREEGGSVEEIPPQDPAVRFLSLLVINRESLSSLWVVPFLGWWFWVLWEGRLRKPGGTSLSAYCSTLFRLCISSDLQDLLCWSFCSDFLGDHQPCGKYKLNKPFPLQLSFWSWCFVAAIEALRQPVFILFLFCGIIFVVLIITSLWKFDGISW